MMVTSMLLAQRLNVFVQTGMAASVYGIALIVFGGIRPRESSALAGMLPRPGGGRAA